MIYSLMASTTPCPAPGPKNLCMDRSPPALEAWPGALFGFPTLDKYAPRVELTKRGCCSSGVKTPQMSKLGKRRVAWDVTGFEPPTKRSPLDVFGDGALRTRDHIGHIAAAVKAHMTQKQLKNTDILAALDELAGTVAKDIKRQVDIAWKNGVAHGEWLKEGECRENAEAAAAAAAVKQENFHLKIDLQSAKTQLEHALARVNELTSTRSNPLYNRDSGWSDPIATGTTNIDLGELQTHLDDLLGDDAQEDKQDEDDDTRVYHALADITNRL